VKSRRWLGLLLALVTLGESLARAQRPQLVLPRPGNIVVASVTGEVTLSAGDQRRVLKVDDRLRVGSTVVTGRRAMLTLVLSNGVLLQLGSEAELELEEFGQAPVSGGGKLSDLKQEPTLSRTCLRLLRGDVAVTVKPLKIAQGSSFLLSTIAGSVEVGEAVFRVVLRMHELGLGIYQLHVQSGGVDFIPAGGDVSQSVPAGRSLGFSLEIDAAGVVKRGELPLAPAQPANVK
jgi:hypothetical protein